MDCAARRANANFQQVGPHALHRHILCCWTFCLSKAVGLHAVPSSPCSSFGTKAVDPKPIMKALPTLFSHTQAGVRDKAKETSVELCAYLGAGVVAGVLLDKMPAAMRKDVDSAVENLPAGKKQPSRFTRREAAERATRQAEAQPMDVDGGEEEGGSPGGEAVEEEPVSVEREERLGTAGLCR